MIKGKVSEGDLKLKYGSGHSLAVQKLSQLQIEYLTDLPEKMIVDLDGSQMMLCHGAPFNKGAYIYPDALNEILEKCDYVGVDFVLIGHSHYPFSRSNKNSTLINVGSVGQSRNQSGFAQWTLINSKTKVFEMRSTPYGVANLLAEVELQDPDNVYLKEVLNRSK